MFSILFNHIYSIAIGIAVCLPCIAMFFAIGNGLLPRRFAPEQGGAIYRCTIGVAVFIGMCWYSLKFAIPLTPVLNYLIAAAVLLAAIAIVRVARNPQLRNQSLKTGLSFAAIFCGYYIIAYAMLPSQFTSKELPISQILGNADVLHYIHYSSYYQRLRFENIFNGDYMGEPYWVTPSAHYFFDLVAVGFHGDVMAATMPLIYGIIAIIGLAVVNLARMIFRISVFSAVLLGAVTISGVFFQYVYGNGFVPQFISSAMMLLGILQVASFWSQTEKRSWLMMVSILTLYGFTLFYTYPAMFLIFFGCLGILVFLKDLVLAGSDAKESRDSIAMRVLTRLPRVAIWWGGAVLASLLLIALFDVSHTYGIVVGYIPNLAGADVGWVLDLLPPYTLLGLPGPMQLGREWILRWTGGAALVALLVIYLYAYRSRVFSPMQKAFAVLGAGAYLGYVAFVAKQGISYQQWKFAAYFPLMWSWIFFPVIGQLIATNLPGLRVTDRSRPLAIFAVCATAFIVLANFAHARATGGWKNRFDGAYADMAVIDSMSEVHELYTAMNSFQSTFFPLYFVQTKLVRLLDNSYYWHDDYDPEKITSATPIFWEGADCGEPGSTQIGAIGCLFRAAPSAKFDEIYALEAVQKTRLFVDATDFSAVESSGARAAVNKAHLSVTMMPENLEKHTSGYLNLHIHPSDTFDVSYAAQFRMGGKLFEAAKLDEDRWISIPWSQADWTGKRAKVLALTIDVPAFDLVPPEDGLEFFSERESIGVLDVSITEAPIGDVLQPR
jgi:hypothetical protein